MNRKAIKILAAAILCALIIPEAPAAPGDLDKTFGQRGRVSLKLPGHNLLATDHGVLVQSDGKILVSTVDHGDLHQEPPSGINRVTRYNEDGSLDLSFNGSGSITPIDHYSDRYSDQPSLALQADGKILLMLDDVLFRYNADGTPDNTFNAASSQPGMIYPFSSQGRSESVQSMEVQADGKILLLSFPGTIIARYTAAGTLDTGFGNGGFADFGPTNAIVIHAQSDGRILVYNSSGSSLKPGVIALKSDGSLDNTFGSNGKVSLPFEFYRLEGDMALQPDGKIVLVEPIMGSNHQKEFVTARLDAKGVLDSTFGEAGIARITQPINNSLHASYSVVVQDDGRILVGGNGFLIRYQPDGVLDPSFHGNGKLRTSNVVVGLGLQRNGDIITSETTDGGVTLIDIGGAIIKRFVPQSAVISRLRGIAPCDVMVRKPDDSADVGENLYGATGSAQKVGVVLAGKLGPIQQHQRNFAIKVRNNSATPGSFEVRASAAEAGFRVQYFDSANVEITKDVVKGRYVLPELAGGAGALLTVRITAQPGAKHLATQRCRVLVRPEGSSNNADADAVVINAVNVSPLVNAVIVQ